MTKTEIKIVLISCLVFAAAILVALSKDVEAAPTPPATKFVWVHDGQDVDGFWIYCADTSGGYSDNQRVQVPDPNARETLISDVLNTGKFYCTMTAYNATGESGYANEIFLDATNGVVNRGPASPTGFGIQ